MGGFGDKLGHSATHSPAALFLRCRFGSEQTGSGERAPNWRLYRAARRNGAAPREAGMAIYRYSFRDEANGTKETREGNFAHDKQAIDNGAAITAGPQGEEMESWRGPRLVQSFGPVSSPDPKTSRR